MGDRARRVGLQRGVEAIDRPGEVERVEQRHRPVEERLRRRTAGRREADRAQLLGWHGAVFVLLRRGGCHEQHQDHQARAHLCLLRDRGSLPTAPAADDRARLGRSRSDPSASGDASLRLIYGGDVAPINTDLTPNYADIFPNLKNQQWNSVDGVAYGVPHGRGANLLAYRTDIVKPAPTSWGAVFDVNSPYKGKITAYDSPIYIADAALYLMKTKPELGIKYPYALDQTQFDAAIELLKAQKPLIGEYWGDYLKHVASIKSGGTVLGTTWQVNINLAKSEGVMVEGIKPIEGATGWSDTWMVSAKAQHPTCMYKWMNWITSPAVNAQVAEYFGESPSQTLSCTHTVDKNFCNTYHATDAVYAKKIWYWTTPTTSCLDGRGNI